MSRRPLSPLSHFLSALAVASIGAVVLGAAACGNISLSSSASGNASPGSSPTLHPPDASADAGSSPGSSPPMADGSGGAQVDAGVPAPPVVGNPLCYLNYGDGGEHHCEPDMSSLFCSSPWADAGDGGDAGSQEPTACHVTAGATQACAAAGTGTDGAQCQTSTDCAASFECIGATGTCRHYCCDGNATCDTATLAGTVTTASFCDVQPVYAQSFSVPACVPVSHCTLLAGKCGPQETCAVVKDDGTTSCVAIGPAGIGDPCEMVHCQDGLTCLGAIGVHRCVKLCHVDTPSECPAPMTCVGSAQLFMDANIGLCQ